MPVEERIGWETWSTERRRCLVEGETYGEEEGRQCEISEHCGVGWCGKGYGKLAKVWEGYKVK